MEFAPGTRCASRLFRELLCHIPSFVRILGWQLRVNLERHFKLFEVRTVYYVISYKYWFWGLLLCVFSSKQKSARSSHICSTCQVALRRTSVRDGREPLEEVDSLATMLDRLKKKSDAQGSPEWHRDLQCMITEWKQIRTCSQAWVRRSWLVSWPWKIRPSESPSIFMLQDASRFLNMKQIWK